MSLTQTVVESADNALPAARRSLVSWLGLLLLTLLGLFLAYKAVTAPTQFIDAVISGINNGALYALVALGYTMVYGIIELINFSHGDLFMLSTILAAFVIIT